jgi:hypothetical protein
MLWMFHWMLHMLSNDYTCFPDVSDVCCKSFNYFRYMLQVFHQDRAKVDLFLHAHVVVGPICRSHLVGVLPPDEWIYIYIALLQEDDDNIQRHKKLYWFRPEPYVQSQRKFEYVFLGWMLWSSYNGYARRVKEVGDWRGTARIRYRESILLQGCSGCPYIDSETRLHTKR